MIALLLAAAAPSSIAIGQHQRVGRFVVTPRVVVEDSRCPMNARCVWAGRVVVRATVQHGRRWKTQLFTLGEPVGGLVLDSVTPDRVAGAPPLPRPYRFHFSPTR